MEDLDLLKNTVARLTAQLSEKLPSSSSSHWVAPINAPDPSAADVPPWILDASIAHPLHAAYDARILELQEIVRDFENNTRGDISLLQSQKQQHTRALSSANSAAEAAQLESTSLREEVLQLRRICAELTQVVEERDVAAEAQLSQHRALTSSLQQVHSALKRLDAEKKSIDAAFSESQSTLHLLRTEHSETLKALREAAQEAESRESQLKSYRTAIEEVAARAGAEAEALALKAKLANEKRRELQDVNEALTNELAAAKADLENKRIELNVTRMDAENMLVSIQASESQLQAIESREEKARSIELAAAEKEAKAQRLVDIAVAGEEDAKRELARLLEKRRIELESQHIKESESVALFRTRLVEAASAREEEILRLRQDSATAQAAAERFQREALSAQSELARAETLALSEQRRLSESIRLLSEKFSRAEEDKDAASHMAMQGEAIAIDRMRDAEAARAEAEQRSIAAEAGIRRISSSLQTAEARNRELSDQLLDVERNLDAQRRETISLKIRAETAEAELITEKGKNQRQAQSSLQQSHQTSGSWVGSSSSLTESSNAAGLAARQTQERAYVDEINRLRSKTREMSSLLIALQRDHAAAVNAATEAEESLIASREACAQAEAATADLLVQVSSAAVREDTLLRTLEDLRTQAELSKLKADRANARAESITKKLEAAEFELMRSMNTNPARVLASSYHQSSSNIPLRSSQAPPQPPIISKKSHSSASFSRHSHSAVQPSKTYIRSHFGSRQITLEDNELEEKLASLGVPPHVADLYEEHSNTSVIPTRVRSGNLSHNSVSKEQHVVDISATSEQVTVRVAAPVKVPVIETSGIAPVMVSSTKSPVKTPAIAASLDPVNTTKSDQVNEKPFEKPFEQKSHFYSQQVYELPNKVTQMHPSDNNLVVDSESSNRKSLDIEPPVLLAQVEETPPVTQVIPLIHLPPLFIPSSSLLLSPRVSDSIIAIHEVETIEETLHAPTHDLDVSLADLEATVETLKQEDDHSNTRNIIENDAPIGKEKKDSSALPAEHINSTIATADQKLEQVEIHEELPLVAPVSISSQIPQTPIQNFQVDLPQASPVQHNSEQVPTSSPLFEIDEDSSFGASPEPILHQKRVGQIDQLALPSVLSPGAALSSVSLSSPAFVLEDAEDALQDEEGDEGDYYGNETEEQSDSFDDDDDNNNDDDDNIKITRKENDPAKKQEDTAFIVEEEEVDVEEIEEEEDEFGNNRDLEEAEDDLDVDDAF